MTIQQIKFIAASLLCFALVSVANADTIHLEGGKSLSGDIVKKTEKSVFVDLGYTIVEVPRADISRIEAPAPVTTENPSTADTPKAGDETKTEEKDIYSRGRLEPITVRDALKLRGEGVVRVRCPGGQGSGFVIDKKGHVVTNYHVIEGEKDVELDVYIEGEEGLEKKRLRDIKIIAVNEFLDLALLRIENADDLDLSPLVFTDTSEASVGETVFAIGAPLGLDRTITEGIVSEPNRSFQGYCYIQMDVAINPGNSGGPLFNSRGEVVGVTNMGYRGMEGLNFAIPADQVIYFLNHRSSFLYDESRPNTGIHYLDPPRKVRPGD